MWWPLHWISTVMLTWGLQLAIRRIRHQWATVKTISHSRCMRVQTTHLYHHQAALLKEEAPIRWSYKVVLSTKLMMKSSITALLMLSKAFKIKHQTTPKSIHPTRSPTPPKKTNTYRNPIKNQTIQKSQTTNLNKCQSTLTWSFVRRIWAKWSMMLVSHRISSLKVDRIVWQVSKWRICSQASEAPW